MCFSAYLIFFSIRANNHFKNSTYDFQRIREKKKKGSEAKS